MPATGLSGIDFAKWLLDAARIAVLPGGKFGQTATVRNRVALTTDDDILATEPARLINFARPCALNAAAKDHPQPDFSHGGGRKIR